VAAAVKRSILTASSAPIKNHVSKTDPEALLGKKCKGKETKLCHSWPALMENRSGLAINTRVIRATGICECEALTEMLAESVNRVGATVGADKGYDCKQFVNDCRSQRITAHVARKSLSAIDGRTTRHLGYAVSLRVRKRVEKIFAWVKSIACLRKLRYRGTAKVSWISTFTAAAYNLVRMRNLGGTTA
jgi:IS5 family transposase